jgi:hypothetical protein
VTLGLRPSEQLQWSFQNQLAMQHDAVKPSAGPATANVALAAGASHVYVWMLDGNSDAGRPKHYMQRYVLPRSLGLAVAVNCLAISGFRRSLCLWPLPVRAPRLCRVHPLATPPQACHGRRRAAGA